MGFQSSMLSSLVRSVFPSELRHSAKFERVRSLHNQPCSSSFSALMVARSSVPLSNCANVFASVGYELSYTSEMDLALEALIENPGAWRLFLIRLDWVVGYDELLEAVEKVRIICPDLPVVLIAPYAEAVQNMELAPEFGDILIPEPRNSSELRGYLGKFISQHLI